MFASSATTIAWVIVAVMAIGFIGFAWLNSKSARAELGSEIELAPNRKPYYDDETLEGPRLERMQVLAVLLLGVITIALPLYWVLEPSRQAGAKEKRIEEFVNWGSQLYDTTANGGFNCAGCHGATGGGGQAPATVIDPKTGQATAVQWNAPALNTVMSRYSDEEIRFIIAYGRPFSPMSPWGTVGGGPMNDQQIETLVYKIRSFQIPRVDCLPSEPDDRICPSGHLPTAKQDEITKDATTAAQALVDAGKYATTDAAMGEALFNLSTDFGAYSCARCHTRGWSYGQPGVPGQGAFGWNLTAGSTTASFPNEADMITFIKNGSEYGKKYGTQAQGNGRMPAFGNLLTDEQIKAIVEYVRNDL